MILCIETSGELCSLALVENESLVYFAQIEEPNAHSKVLMPLIDKLLKDHLFNPKHLSAVALSAGPGSYTGLRIGSAAAKSICMALFIPLITISTLEILAIAMKNENPNSELYIPLLDARRMEVYMAVFDKKLNRKTEDIPHVLSEESLHFFEPKDICLGGSGAAKTVDFLNERNIHLSTTKSQANAKSMVKKAIQLFNDKQFTDLVNFEPAYLKPFYTNAKPLQTKL